MKQIDIYKIIVIIFGLFLIISYISPILLSESNISHISFIYLLTFFIIIAFIIAYLSNIKLSKEDKNITISYTMSYALFGVLFIPLFVFNNIRLKDTVVTILLFFCWITSTKIFSKFLTTKKNVTLLNDYTTS